MVGTIEQIKNWLLNQDKTKKYQIKEYKPKRSLSQNAYAWELITQMGNVLRKSKEEVYLQMLIDYGQSEQVSILSSIEPQKWFKYFESVGASYIDGKFYTTYRIYKGSSEFDSKEMTIFIDGIIHECEQLGIHTLTQKEIERMRLN